MSLTDDVATTEPPKSKISWLLIWLDNLILSVRVLYRRMKLSVMSGTIFRRLKKENVKITYIDVGTHVAAKELLLMREHVLPSVSNDFKCIGIEANESSFKLAKEKFENDKFVSLLNAAACREIPESGYVELHLHGDGHGDSMYRVGEKTISVPAMKLSGIVKKESEDANRIILVRMNIEGAEYDVLRDLDENGLIDKIDGFYGMWDDLSKIDVELDKKMIEFMKDRNIKTLTFNERDFVSEYRIKVISYDIRTSIICSKKCHIIN